MRKLFILLTFLTISFFSYGKSNVVNPSQSIEIKNIDTKQVLTDLNTKIFRDYYQFEVTTSCGTIITIYQSCDCDYWQLMTMASSIGISANQQACPDDTPGSQHVRVIMP